MSSKIIIIDYGMGNLSSVKRKLSRIKVDALITSNPHDVLTADKIILPGVGHFQMAMENIMRLNLLDVLNEAVLIKHKPILGICLGMQLMANKSEEGNVPGLGWIDGDVVRFKVSNTKTYKIPHMGWNSINIQKESRIMSGLNNSSSFYFVHSYYVNCNDKNDILCKTNYGIEYTSAVEKNNITGMQFHPEKSHDEGLQIINNFAKDF